MRIFLAGVTISKQWNHLKANVVDWLQSLKTYICQDLMFRNTPGEDAEEVALQLLVEEGPNIRQFRDGRRQWPEPDQAKPGVIPKRARHSAACAYGRNGMVDRSSACHLILIKLFY